MFDDHGITMSECKVELWYNKQRVNKKTGKATLYLELTINGEIDYIKFKGLRWQADKFNWPKRSLESRYPDDPDRLAYNAIIERDRAKYWRVIKNFLLEDRAFNLADVYRAVNLYKSGQLFCEFMKQGIRDRQKTLVKADMIKSSTATGHNDTVDWLMKFLNLKDIEIMQVDGDLLEAFANYLRKHMAEASVWKRIQNVKSYLSYAFRHKILINHDHKRFTIAKPEPDPTWLNEDELNRLLNIYYGIATTPTEKESVEIIIELPAELQETLSAFLFACFTGLRISDLQRWSKDWLQDDHISFVPVKQKKSTKDPKPVIIPIIPIARQFIDDLKTKTFRIPAEQVYNRRLKEIANIAGINKNITSHVARHTFATWLAIEGVSVLVISKLLGHKNTNTTMIYIHIAEQYLAREMIKLQGRFGLRPKLPLLGIA